MICIRQRLAWRVMYENIFQERDKATLLSALRCSVSKSVCMKISRLLGRVDESTFRKNADRISNYTCAGC